LLAVSAAACASSGRSIEVDTIKDEPRSSDYVIGFGDEVRVLVFADDRLSTNARVRDDGKISLPYLNDVQAAGKTTVQLAADIDTGLKALYQQPQVTVSLVSSSSLTISVLGEVSHPGLQSLPHDPGVADALAAAGGLTQFAHKDRIFVV